MKRSLPWVAAAALALAAPAAAGVRVAGVDTGSYPELRVTVVAPLGSGTPFLREDGRPVVGLQATNLGRAKSVVLAVDRSQSMRGTGFADAISAARGFVGSKRATDRVEVIAFGRQALALTRFSNSTVDADAALRGLRVDRSAGTALWDAVVTAARRLSHEDQPGHVIVVVTDGADVSSTASFAQAVAAAHRARASVYAIGIAGPDFTSAPLRELAAETGGVYREASSSAELGTLYTSIGRLLDRTWQLTYPTSARPGETVTLAVTVPGSGASKQAFALPGIGSSTVVADKPSLLPASAWRSGTGVLVLAGAVGVLALLACAFLTAARSGMWLSARLAPHLAPEQRRRKERRRRDSHALRGLFTSTEETFSRLRQFQALQQRLARADMPLLAAELLYLCIGIAVVLGVMGGLAGVPLLFVAVLMLLGGSAPLLYVSFKARRRIKAFDNQLPDLLITIAASLKAGHSFRHAIQAVVDEGADPAAKEFTRVLTETRLGRPMDAALADLAERIGSKNLSFVLTAVTIQRQIGGSLAGLFDIVAETVRQRQQFARKIRGLTAMGRMSGYVLTALPFLIGLAVTALNRSYMSPLWTTSTGHKLVIAGFLMLLTGGAILKKIVSFRG